MTNQKGSQMTKGPAKGYVQLADGSVRRIDTPPHPTRPVLGQFSPAVVEREELDLDYTRKHRDELRAAAEAAKAAEK